MTRLSTPLMRSAVVAAACAACPAIPARPAMAQDTTLARPPLVLPPPPDTGPPLRRVTAPVRIGDIGPGMSGRMLRGVLARPHVVLAGDSTRALDLRRDTAFATTVVVLEGDATVASRVSGDVVVIGGDLYLHPGARIDGRVIVFGGGLYNSSLATVAGGRYVYRDHTFEAQRGGSDIALHYRELEGSPVPVIAFPAFGLHLPEYTRVDGLALPWGPTITLADGGVELVPTITWRTHMGAVDPRLAGDVRLGKHLRLEGEIGRATFSNDRWNRPDLVNSMTTFIAGVDTRNYFRADRAEVRVTRAMEGATTVFTPFVGARAERAWGTGPDSVQERAPFSVFGRRDRDRMLRPNPGVMRGNTSSALVGARLDSESPTGLVTGIDLLVEAAVDAPGSGRFTQVTTDVDVAFPTFGTQSFVFRGHVLHPLGGDAPPQRWAYLGGAGTLVTRELLDMGGDRLVYAESQYRIPLTRPAVPFLGPPLVTLRHAIGSAGVGRLPSFTQNIGFRVTIGFLRFDYAIDPDSRRSRADVSVTVPQ